MLRGFWNKARTSHALTLLTIDEEEGVETEAVGESFYAESITLIVSAMTLRGERIEDQQLIVDLQTDDDNPHDPMAVSLHIVGRKVGHLARDDAREMRANLAKHGIHRWKAEACGHIGGRGLKEDGTLNGPHGVILHFGLPLEMDLVHKI